MPYFKELRIMTYLNILVELEVISLLIERQEKDEDKTCKRSLVFPPFCKIRYR